MLTIDYSPLSEPRPGASPKFGAVRYLKPVLIITLTIAVLLFMTPVLALLFRDSILVMIVASSAPMLGMMVFIGLVVAGVIYGMNLRKEQLARLQRFADVNQATLIHDTAVNGYKGLIFDNGRDRKMREAIRFSDGLEIGNYNFTTGSGKNTQIHVFAFVRVPLTRELPHMVLDARQGNMFGSNLPDTFSRSQRLQLEGNFNDHFDVYVPKEYEADALYVFTPDVMQALLDNGRNLDVEIIGRELYIYRSAPLDISSALQLQSFLAIVDKLSNEITTQTNRYSDDRGGVAADGTRMVAAQGRQLKTGMNGYVVLFIGLVIAINAGIFLLPKDYIPLYTIATTIIFWATILFFVFRGVRRRP